MKAIANCVIAKLTDSRIATILKVVILPNFADC